MNSNLPNPNKRSIDWPNAERFAKALAATAGERELIAAEPVENLARAYLALADEQMAKASDG